MNRRVFLGTSVAGLAGLALFPAGSWALAPARRVLRPHLGEIAWVIRTRADGVLLLAENPGHEALSSWPLARSWRLWIGAARRDHYDGGDFTVTIPAGALRRCDAFRGTVSAMTFDGRTGALAWLDITGGE